MASFTVCLTHDVDRTKKTYQYISHFLKEVKAGNVNRALYHLKSFFGRNPYWNFDRIIALEEKHKIRSTFFFLHETLGFNPFLPESWKKSFGYYELDTHPIAEIITYLDENGWEIGLHGSYNSYKNIELLISEKRKLEAILMHEVLGIRQHYLNLEIPLTWELQRRAGFVYDASYGIKNKVQFPNNHYLPFKNGESGMVILPLAIMDTYLFGISCNADVIWQKCLEIIDEAELKNGLLVILWHQRVFNENEFPLHTKVYERIIEECVNRKARFKLCRQIYGDFVKRER